MFSWLVEPFAGTHRRLGHAVFTKTLLNVQSEMGVIFLVSQHRCQ
jgi:hypothetical protein